MNPDPDGAGLSLNNSETDNALSFDLALEVAPYFRLKAPVAESILQEVRDAVGLWKEQANTLGIARSEQEIMGAAYFRTHHADPGCRGFLVRLIRGPERTLTPGNRTKN